MAGDVQQPVLAPRITRRAAWREPCEHAVGEPVRRPRDEIGAVAHHHRIAMVAARLTAFAVVIGIARPLGSGMPVEPGKRAVTARQIAHVMQPQRPRIEAYDHASLQRQGESSARRGAHSSAWPAYQSLTRNSISARRPSRSAQYITDRLCRSDRTVPAGPATRQRFTTAALSAK